MVQRESISFCYSILLPFRCIGLRRNERGSLLACLVSKNETRVDVQFGFTLVNHDADENSHRTGKETRFRMSKLVNGCSTGDLHAFSFMNDYCEHDLLSCSQIASQDFGFLRENCFLVRLDMRLKRDDSESFQISVDRKTAICQVISPVLVVLPQDRVVPSGS